MKKAQRPKKPTDAEARRLVLEKLATVFKLLSEPTRLTILHELRTRSQSVGELVTTLGTSQANVSKQLRILFDSGLLTRQQVGNQVFYRIGDEGIFDLCHQASALLNRRHASSSPLDYTA